MIGFVEMEKGEKEEMRLIDVDAFEEWSKYCFRNDLVLGMLFIFYSWYWECRAQSLFTFSPGKSHKVCPLVRSVD